MAVRATQNFLGETGNHKFVYDREDSHLHSEGGLSLELLREGLRKITMYGGFKKFEIDMGRPIGFTTCVPVTPDNEVVMVYRLGRAGQTPMVKNRLPIPCNWLTIILRWEKTLGNHNTLITAYIGAGSPPEPWDKCLKTIEDKAKSEEFWKTHALIYDESLIDWERTAV